MNEIVGPASPGRGLDDLLPDPRDRWVGGHLEVDQLPAIVRDEEQHVDDPITYGLDHEQIGSPDPSELIRQKRPPGLSADRCWLPPAIATDRSFADVDAQLEQFAANSLTAPERVVPGHGGDEVANSRRSGEAVRAGSVPSTSNTAANPANLSLIHI